MHTVQVYGWRSPELQPYVHFVLRLEFIYDLVPDHVWANHIFGQVSHPEKVFLQHDILVAYRCNGESLLWTCL